MSIDVSRSAFTTSVVQSTKEASTAKSRPAPPVVLQLLLCAVLIATLCGILFEVAYLKSDVTPDDRVQQLLNAAEEASPILASSNESSVNDASYYPEEIFEVDWSHYIDESDLLHENALHRACVTHKNSVIPWTFGHNGQDRVEELREIVNRSDPMLLEKLRVCPDVELFLPHHLRNFGYCEDAAAYTKFLGSRMLPRWVLEVKFEDVKRNRSITYHDLCPHTPMLFFNHYWEGVPDALDWPRTKPLYLMPNIEMYELNERHYWRANVILCKTALCARYFNKWFRQEGNPRDTRVVYTRHTTTNLALLVQKELAANPGPTAPPKQFANVSFLHTAGKSIQKGTRQVLDCWLREPDLPRLDFYVDQELYNGSFSDYGPRLTKSPNVYLHTGRLSATEFGHVVAQGRYFLCPSMMEGYGHYINQARSANAFIITTNAAPMNELITPSSGALIHARVISYGEQFMGGVSNRPFALRNISGLVGKFEYDDVCDTVMTVLQNSTLQEREQRAHKALQQYYFDTVFFARKMKALRSYSYAKSHPSLRGRIRNQHGVDAGVGL